MVASWRDNACQDRLGARREDFIHDGLNRLTAATVTDTGTLAVLGATTAAYDTIGNITAKSDVGAYTYDGLTAGPHAVTRAGDVDYAYDANGNMASSSFVAGGAAHRAFAWSSFNKPLRMENSVTGAASEFVYGPSRARVKQTELQGAAVTQTTVYIGADFERVAPAGGSDELVHYIRAGGERVAIFTHVDDANPATDKTRWLHKDHLGSIDLVTDEAGLAAEARSFDPWGRPRNADWTPAPADPFLAETPRGFTDHEHIQTVGLIHMNGRVQDPVLGRFISPDPSDALNPGVGFNRYSYVLNNPLSLVDPDGFDSSAEDDPQDVSGNPEDDSWGENRDEPESDVASGRRDIEEKMFRELEAVLRSYPRWQPGYHYYPVGPNTVCKPGRCTETTMKDQLPRFTVPGRSPAFPVANNETSDVYDRRFAVPIPGGRVKTRITQDGLTGVNRTLPGHIMYDGEVARGARMMPDGSWVSITVGEGVNSSFARKELNEIVGPGIFEDMDKRWADWNEQRYSGFEGLGDW